LGVRGVRRRAAAGRCACGVGAVCAPVRRRRWVVVGPQEVLI
jgi:hypothetical protein